MRWFNDQMLDGVDVDALERNVDQSPAARATTAGDIALVALVLLATAIVLSKDISLGGLRYGDTAVHAMDGVLIHDWIAAGPKAWLSPMAFAEQQYGHYPCLGIGRHYPPAFAIVEAGFFAVFGISVFTARLCVVFFGLIAAAGAYVFMRTFTDRPTSVIGAMMLMTLPAVTIWGRQTMLEVPLLAALTWGAVAVSRYLERPTWLSLFGVFAVALVTLLFRQTGVFFLGAVAMTLAYGALRRSVPWRHCFLCVAVALLAIVAVTASLEGDETRMFRGRATYPSLWHVDALTYYFRQLPAQVGVAVLCAALAGIVVWPRKHRLHLIFMVCWFVVVYVMLSAADLKWARFFFAGLFPFAVCAAVAVGRLYSILPLGGYRPAVASLIVLGLCCAALAQPVEHHPDYGEVIAAHKQEIRHRAVLVSGVRDNHFVFAVRQHLPWRETVVIRASKLLYVCTAIPGSDLRSYVDTAADLARMMNRFAFAYVFTERDNRWGVAQEGLLRDYLTERNAYDRIAAYPLPAEPEPTWRDTTIDVYKLALPITRQAKHLDIPIPRANRTVRVDLSRWSG